MIYLAIICVLLLAVLILRETQHERHIDAREKTWDLERGALLTRIQHPEVVLPPPRVEEPPVPEEQIEETDDIDLVGTVVDGPSEAVSG